MRSRCCLSRIRLLVVLLVLFILFASTASADDETSTELQNEVELTSKVSALLDYLDLDGKGEYDIIFAIYNYICQTVEYDWTAIDNFPWDGESLGCGQTAYEALCQEKAVCAGIAKAITLLMEGMNVPCKTVIGYKAGIGHAWNLVQLDGQWYFVDATDDLGQANYTHFLQTLADLGDYVVLEDGEIILEEINLASTSYASEVQSTMDSYAGFSFNIGLGDITIFSYEGTEKNLVIPSEIKGRRVNRIAQYCIRDNDTIETLVISEGIERINSLFASQCPKLRSIEIPSTAKLVASSSGSIQTGGESLVAECFSMETIKVSPNNPYLCVIDNVLYNSSLTELLYYPVKSENTVVHVPNGVQAIKSGSFAYNPYLQEVVLPDSILSIGYWAFQHCSALEKVNIPQNCEMIDQYAFDCTKLEEIHIPAATRWIASPAFSCETLRCITVDEANPYYYAVDNVLFSSEGELIAYAAKKEETVYVVPSDVTVIEFYSFMFASNLKQVILPEGLTKIDVGAFVRCTSLESMVIPNTVTCIGSQAFLDCYSLVKIVIPPSVTDIGDLVLANVHGAVVWGSPDSVAQSWAIQNGYAFHDMTQIWNVSGNCGANISWDISEQGDLAIWGTGALEPSSAQPWKQYANMIRTVQVSEGVTSIGSCSFRGLKNMTSVVLPQSVITIETQAFANCSSIAYVELPYGVATIGSDVFYDCPRLTEVVIPASVTYIDRTAFNTPGIVICGKLGSVAHSWAESNGYEFRAIDSSAVISGTCGDNITWTLTDDGALDIVGMGEMKEYPWSSYANTISCISISEGVTSICDWAFFGNYNLLSVTLPDSLQSIGKKAFAGCYALTNINLPPNLLSIGTHAFNNCRAITHLELPDSATDIGELAFNGCSSLISVRLPKDLKTIPRYAFSSCTSLEHIEIPQGLTGIGSYAFEECTSLRRMEIPKSVTQLGEYAFADCTALSMLIMPDYAYIWSSTFKGCNPTVYCYIGSYVETWAKGAGFPVCPIELLDLALPDDCMLQAGTTISIGAELSPEVEAYLTRQSSDESVVMVQSHLLTAVGAGTATIAVSCNGEVLDKMIVTVSVDEDPHTWGSGVIIELPDCMENGMIIYLCEDCGITKVETLAARHRWDRGVYLVEQTCIETGLKEYACSVCGTTKTSAIAPHFWGNGVLETVPTTESAGMITYTCQQCGETKTEQIMMGISGDVNEDKLVDMLDVINLMEWFCGGCIELNLANADVNGTGDIDMLDIMTLMEWHCNAEESFNNASVEVIE